MDYWKLALDVLFYGTVAVCAFLFLFNWLFPGSKPPNFAEVFANQLERERGITRIAIAKAEAWQRKAHDYKRQARAAKNWYQDLAHNRDLLGANSFRYGSSRC